jgi:hypothetical protein
MQVLEQSWDKYLNANDVYVEVECVPSTPMCDVYIEVGINFSALEGVTYFFETSSYYLGKAEYTVVTS